jgi:hypothetical protein
MATIPSIAMIPSGYKASKVYSVLPTDGAGDLTFSRAGALPSFNATRVNSEGLIEEVLSNVPRLDYSDGGCPSLLIEPESRNLALRSEEFDNESWSRIALESIVSNTEISPNGTLTAEKIIPNTTSTNHYVVQNATVVIEQAYTFSFFAKKGEYNFTSTFISGLGISANWDLQNGIASAGASIVDFGNGWYRCIVSGVAISTTAFLRIYAQNSTLSVLAGDGTSGIYIWGAQLEALPYASSYIPTVASTVTRVAETVSKTGISDLIGQTEGVLFVEFEKEHNGVETISINDGSALNRVYLGFNGSNFISQVRSGGGTAQASFTTALTNNQTYKCALAYKLNDFVLYINGVQIGTDNLGIVPVGMSNFSFNASTNVDAPFFSPVNQALLFKTRLSNAELESLTTL